MAVRGRRGGDVLDNRHILCHIDLAWLNKQKKSPPFILSRPPARFLSMFWPRV